MNSENSKTFKPNILILKLIDKLDLGRGEEIYSLIKSYYLIHMEKHKKLMQLQ